MGEGTREKVERNDNLQFMHRFSFIEASTCWDDFISQNWIILLISDSLNKKIEASV